MLMSNVSSMNDEKMRWENKHQSSNCANDISIIFAFTLNKIISKILLATLLESKEKK